MMKPMTVMSAKVVEVLKALHFDDPAFLGRCAVDLP